MEGGTSCVGRTVPWASGRGSVDQRRLGSEAKGSWNTTTRISIATGGRVPERLFNQASCSCQGLCFCTLSKQENEHGFSQLWSAKDGECCRSSSASAFPEACNVCWGTGKKFLNAKASLTPLLFHCLWKHFFLIFYSKNQLRWESCASYKIKINQLNSRDEIRKMLLRALKLQEVVSWISRNSFPFT